MPIEPDLAPSDFHVINSSHNFPGVSLYAVAFQNRVNSLLQNNRISYGIKTIEIIGSIKLCKKIQ